jgi:glucose-1-phosphate thymidylyltransferase
VLYYGLEAIAAAGIREVGIIVSDPRELLQPDHRTGEMVTTLVNSQAEIRAAVGDGSQFGLRVTYLEQEAPLGLAHAVKIAEDFMAGDSFVMYLGDNLIKDGIVPFVEEFEREKPEAQILLAKVARPWEFGVAELDGERIVRLEEKPKQPRSDLALVGVYLFTKSIFDAVRAIKPSPRGELEITDAIQYLITTGRNVRSHVIHGWWKDTGRVEDLLEANRIVLADLVTSIEGQVDDATVIEGPVHIAPGARVERSRLRGPLVLGAGAHIVDAYVGPFSAIADGVRIEQCEVEHSIVLDRSQLLRIPGRIESSLIGRDVVVTASDARPSAHRFMLGDSSRVELA